MKMKFYSEICSLLLSFVLIISNFKYVIADNKGTSNGGFGSNSGIKCSSVEIVNRTEWKAKNPKTNLDKIQKSNIPVKKIFIHHTTTKWGQIFSSCNTNKECENEIRDIQNEHMRLPLFGGRGFDDIGYNYLVGEDGRAYEGRGWDKIGAHTYGYNQVSVAIAVIGYFNDRKPNEDALQAVKALIACAIDEGFLDANYELYGHRDAACSTECPGQKLYDEIKTWSKYSIKTLTKWKEGSSNKVIPSQWTCDKYGNILRIDPNGASKETAKLDNLHVTGVKASYRMVAKDLIELNKYKTCFYNIGDKYGIHPTLIAALVSRESRGGIKTKPNRYGLLQCDVENSGLDCKQFGKTSCEHVEMMVKEKLVVNLDSMKIIHDKWEPHLQLQGAVAAYDIGICQVESYRNPDKGTTRGDYSSDVIARAQGLIYNHGWCCSGSKECSSQGGVQLPGSDNTCVEMQKNGNCEFYKKCVEEVIECKSSGYALGYGYKYCVKFGELIDSFDDKGKTWVNEVRICLMRALHPQAHCHGMTCDRLKDIAFHSHVGCYLHSAQGICEIAWSAKNLLAFVKVFELGDFFWRQDRDKAWMQVCRTLKRCDSKYGGSIPGAATKIAYNELYTPYKFSYVNLAAVILRVGKRSTNSECKEFARKGDCRFYECFEEKFPCTNVANYSHIKDFELVNCLEFDRMGISNNRIKSWVENTQKCLMTELLQHYERSSVNCFEIEMLMGEKHASCMVTGGFCALTKSDEWTISRGTDSKGFPNISPTGYSSMPISKSVHMIQKHYYEQLNEFKRDIGLANEICVSKGERKSAKFYRIVDSPQYGKVKIRNEL